MKILFSNKDCDGYTLMKQVLINLGLDKSDYNWLITDIEAYPNCNKYEKLITDSEFLFLSTNELMNMLEEDDFQWIWAIFSAIPSKYNRDEVLKYNLPDFSFAYVSNNSISPVLQHPLAEIELDAFDSSGLFLITELEDVLECFKTNYPLAKEQ